MKRKLLVIAVSMLLIFSTLPGIAIGANVELNLSTSSAKIGDLVTTTGTADPNEWVSIKVMDSLKNIVFFDAVKSNSSGNYSCQFEVPDVSAGTLTVVAGYGSNVANRPLTVTKGTNGDGGGSGGGSSGGGSGGGTSNTPVTSTTGKASVNPSAGGTVGQGQKAIVEIPANALKEKSAVEVKVVVVSTPPTVPANAKLASEVFEFTIGNNSSYSFAKPVIITLTFDPKLVDENDNVAIHYYDEKAEKWVNIGGTISGNTISVKVDHFTKFAVLGIPKAEKDPEDVPATGETLINLTDINGHWAEANINKLVNMKAISGYPDSTFRPNNSITRAEFATVLVKAFKLNPQDGKVFTDTDNHWAKDYIATANAHNIVSGYSDTNFGPDDVITREQMAVMIVNAAKLNNTTTDKTFADESQISEWAKDAVAKASGAGIITGYPDNTFRPKANATRAEAVTVIVKGNVD